MDLIEFRGLFEMDTGAASPTVLSNENELFVIFYGDSRRQSDFPQEWNTVYDTGVFVLKFTNCLKHTFGMPGDETFRGYRYYAVGMRPYSFYELNVPDWIEELQAIDRAHPRFNPDKWPQYKHYIITFHDSMFECVAQGFEIREENASLYSQVGVLLNELSLKQI